MKDKNTFVREVGCEQNRNGKYERQVALKERKGESGRKKQRESMREMRGIKSNKKREREWGVASIRLHCSRLAALALVR